MNKSLINSRFDELIIEGEKLWNNWEKDGCGIVRDVVSYAQWMTSSLNLLDKLSVTSNRFVTQFDMCANGTPYRPLNVGAALGVLKSSKIEFNNGLAIEYHLSVSSLVFNGILDEAEHLLSKGFYRASAVLIGAALEECLKARAKSESIEIQKKDGINAMIIKLKSPSQSIINDFEANTLSAVAKMRNDAAHGGEFNYPRDHVKESLEITRKILEKLLVHK